MSIANYPDASRDDSTTLEGGESSLDGGRDRRSAPEERHEVHAAEGPLARAAPAAWVQRVQQRQSAHRGHGHLDEALEVLARARAREQPAGQLERLAVQR